MTRQEPFCGFQWRDGEGEHMCFEPISHSAGVHRCECDKEPTNR